MATAPTPGVGRRAEEAQDATEILTITIRGDSKRLAINNVPIGEQEVCLQETGRPYEDNLAEPFGTIKIARLWWLARRASGEKRLTWRLAQREWPEDLDFEQDVEVDFTAPEDEATDPEA